MKPFITKEQAEYLYKSIHQYASGDGWSHVSMAYVKEVIKQCTEEEFPAFEQTMHDTKIIINLADGIYAIHLELADNINEETIWTRLDYPSFKRFARSVNEVVKWIDEQ
jgi:hypothetical protein